MGATYLAPSCEGKVAKARIQSGEQDSRKGENAS